MIGTIGVAPEDGKIPCNTPGSHGGNLDTPFITENVKLLLPVFHEGALLALGDSHARQGDVEVSGISAEVSSTVKLRTNLSQNEYIKSPQIRYENKIITLGSAESIYKSAQKALSQMVKLINHEFGLMETSAYLLCTLIGDLKVSQVVNPLKTVGVELEGNLVQEIIQST